MRNGTLATDPESSDARFAFSSFWLVLGLLTLVIRLPYFFVGVIDWDESTFILMGHAIAAGFLPYEHVWDNKPPLLFAVFAVLAAVPGDPVLVVRVFGAICVLVTAVLVYLLAQRICDRRGAGIAAVLYIVGMATSGAGQSTMSELVSTLPLLAAAWLLVAVRRRTIAVYAAVGALLSIATLIRLNLGIVVIALGLWIVAVEYRGGFRGLVSTVTAYAVAGLLVLAIVALPYVLSGQVDLFWHSVFGASFRYATTQGGLIENLFAHARRVFDPTAGYPPGRLLFGWIASVAAVAGLILAARRYRRLSGERRDAAVIVVLAALGTTLSILMSGAALPHYLIALLPFAAIFAGAAYAALATRVSKVAAIAITATAVVFVLLQVSREYRALAQRLAAGERLMYGPAYDVADYLRSRCGPDCSVYLSVDHLAYVLIGAYPPRKIVTHPSNIAKRSLLSADIGTASTPALEMQALLALRPEYIVKRDEVGYLEREQALLLAKTLGRDYELTATLGDRRIYHAKTP
ncbi:MAG TPA: glycosyltransferase family 39 protein [Gammaproteobacteria bacterium]